MFDSDELRSLATDSKYHTVQVSSRELLELLAEYDRLQKIGEAATNMCAVKGRHHSEIAMTRLMRACGFETPNA
jgi:hypothetical protein